MFFLPQLRNRPSGIMCWHENQPTRLSSGPVVWNRPVHNDTETLSSHTAKLRMHLNPQYNFFFSFKSLFQNWQIHLLQMPFLLRDLLCERLWPLYWSPKPRIFHLSIFSDQILNARGGFSAKSWPHCSPPPCKRSGWTQEDVVPHCGPLMPTAGVRHRRGRCLWSAGFAAANRLIARRASRRRRRSSHCWSSGNLNIWVQRRSGKCFSLMFTGHDGF